MRTSLNRFIGATVDLVAFVFYYNFSKASPLRILHFHNYITHTSTCKGNKPSWVLASPPAIGTLFQTTTSCLGSASYPLLPVLGTASAFSFCWQQSNIWAGSVQDSMVAFHAVKLTGFCCSRCSVSQHSTEYTHSLVTLWIPSCSTFITDQPTALPVSSISQTLKWFRLRDWTNECWSDKDFLLDYIYSLLFRYLLLSHLIQLMIQQKQFSIHFQRPDMSLHDSDHSLSQLEAEQNTPLTITFNFIPKLPQAEGNFKYVTQHILVLKCYK